MSVWTVVQVAVPWLWIGMVLAISFMEAPLKFRAPGITTDLGVGIGRLVFRALNRIETAFAVAVVVALLAGELGTPTTWVSSAIAIAMLVSKYELRRRMDRRARRVLTDRKPSPALHVLYVVAEVVTVVALATLGFASLDHVHHS